MNEAADDIYNNQSHLDKVILTYLYQIFTSYLQYLLDINEIFIEYQCRYQNIDTYIQFTIIVSAAI